MRSANFLAEGRLLAERAGSNSVGALESAYWTLLPYVEVEQSTKNRILVVAHEDPFLDALREIGLSEAQLGDVSGLFWVHQEATIRGFNPSIRWRRTGNLLPGGAEVAVGEYGE